MVPISLFQFVLIYLQVASLCARGLAACYVSGAQHDECVMTGALEGSYRLVLFTPEMLLEKKIWREMLLGTVYTSRLQVFVVDEAHTVKKW